MLGWRETHVEKIGEPSFERRFVTFSQRLNCKKRQRSTTISSTRFRRTQTPTTCGCDRRWSMSSRPIKISDRPVTLIRSPSTTSSLKEMMWSRDYIIFEGVIGNVWVEMRKTRVPFLDAARAALDAS